VTDTFIGEIKMFGGGFAPRGFAFCDGQLLTVSQNEPLFSLLGTTYGGDGRTTFGLPDLRGRLPIHQGAGPGLTSRQIGAKSGLEAVTVSGPQLPVHTHGLQASSDPANEAQPSGAVLADAAADVYIDGTPDLAMNAAAILPSGGGQSHDNVMPYSVINYIIALTGIFPSRN